MRKFNISCRLLFFLLLSPISLLYAGSIIILWDRGPEPDIAGYLVWYGPAPEKLTNFVIVRDETQHQFQNLLPGKIYYFALQTFDYSANLSKISPLVTAVMPPDNHHSDEIIYSLYQKHEAEPLLVSSDFADHFSVSPHKADSPVLQDSLVVFIEFDRSGLYEIGLKTESAFETGEYRGKVDYQFIGAGYFLHKTTSLNNETLSFKIHATSGRHLFKLYTKLEFADSRIALFSGALRQSVAINDVIETPVDSGRQNILVAFLQNYPNPFFNGTHIFINLLVSAQIRLAVYNVLGREVKVLYSGKMQFGMHDLFWDGRDKLRRLVAGGPYLLILHARSINPQKKISQREIRIMLAK